ncbi:UNVERIFIED_CONTAM: hypothetical protein K2H54_044829 [Gekko kuhli]
MGLRTGRGEPECMELLDRRAGRAAEGLQEEAVLPCKGKGAHGIGAPQSLELPFSIGGLAANKDWRPKMCSANRKSDQWCKRSASGGERNTPSKSGLCGTHALAELL